MKNVSTYCMIGLEVVGIWLISMHRYMQFRSTIFMVMAIIGMVYFLCETIIRVVKINAIADIESTLYGLTDEDLENVREIVEEIEKKNE